MTGYDLCTGLGTPNGAALINALAQPSDALQISATTFVSIGPVGGPFSPPACTYMVVNSGTGTLNWTAGATQTWLSLSATAGTLGASGSATVTASINANGNLLASGTYSDVVTFTDVATSYTQSSPVSLTVVAPPVITSALAVTATGGHAFTYQITASNNPTSFTASGLPAGLTLTASNGLISGTTSVTGTTDVTISAINIGGTGSAVLALNVVPPPPSITSSLSTTATNGAAFSYQITASGNPTGFGAAGLPAGLSVNTSDGVISGTTTATGTSNVTISAVNSTGTGSAILSLIVLPPPPVITSATTATASNDVGFSYQITASNNPTTYHASGLPSGLHASSSTGIISGTTTATGTSNVTISAINTGGTGTAILVLAVLPPHPSITSSLVATASNGVSFTYQITASFNPSSFNAANLPSGLLVNTSSGLISGTTTATGTSDVTISAINTGGTGSATLVLTVLPPPPVITSATSATAVAGLPFSYLITASNNPTSYNASNLPTGLSVNASTGVISGTASGSGTANVTITASNSGGSGSGPLTLAIIPQPPPVILTGTLNTIFSLTGTNGSFPGSDPTGGAVQAANGSFYAAISAGGAANKGDLVAYTSQGAFGEVLAFTGTNGSFPGASPRASLIQASDNQFYGTTLLGGTANGGAAFKTTQGGSFTLLASFSGTNGLNPSGGLIQASNANFYGATGSGGAYGNGTIFTLTSAGALTRLVSFTGTNGATPMSPLIQTTNGNFYGATYQGGAANDGTVFTMTSSGSLTTLCSFSGSNGAYPAGGLVQASDGNFYGTTSQGGSANDGTLFRVTSSGSLTTLCSFTGVAGANPGQYPQGSLIQAADGNLYGTASYGAGGNYGTLFNVTLSGSLSTLYVFTDGTDGAHPLCTLAQGSDGNFYGTASAGGASGLGTAYKFTPNLIVSGTVGAAFTYQINATNNPTGYNATGLPSGLSVNTSTGLISGTAANSGTSAVTVSATNGGGTGSAILTFVIHASPLPVITSALAVTATENQPFQYQVAATNNPTSYNAAGLPPGLSINTSTGIISGTCTVGGTTSAIALTASNAYGFGQATLSLTVETPYSAWQDQFFTPTDLSDPAISGDTADPAGDGIPNLMKYALGLDPFSNGTAGLPVSAIITTGSGNYLTLTYTQVLSDTDITYAVQVSTDMTNWNSGPGYTDPPTSVNDPGGATQTVTVQSATPINGATPVQFMRLQVTGP